MSSSLKCPFCHSELRYSDGCIDRKQNTQRYWNHYFCDENSCMNDDMPRYSVNYSRTSKGADDKKLSCSFMIGTYYVQIDWQEDVSVLSTLEGPLLIGSVTLPKALDLDMADLVSVEERIRTLLLFS